MSLVTAPTTPVARPSSTGRSGAGTNAAGTESPSNPSVSARTPRFAPEHPLSVILANQARDAALYGDADRINAMRQA
jgi:hypothetical protein